MRSFALSFLLFILVIAAFVGGLIGAQSAPMLMSFCAMPFILFALGWSSRGLLNGRRLALVESNTARATPSQQRRPVRPPADATL